MITEETVFVLGAGASKPYGFPLGQELVQMILDGLNPDEEDNQDVCELLYGHIGINQARLKEFLSDLADSGAESVDAFLEHRTDLVEIGKFAIASMLLLSESRNSLREPNEEAWYQYFLKMLNAPYERFHENRVSIITYNYDRSLEEYLYRALRVRERTKYCEADWAKKLRDAVPIVHLHGQLGKHPSFPAAGGPSAVPYGSWGNNYSLGLAANGIRIIHEDFNLDEDPAFKEAYRLLSKASHIFFLGFGYHPTNVKRLKLDADGSIKANIYGTAFGFEEAEKIRIHKLFGPRLSTRNITATDVGVLSLLRKSNVIQSNYE